MIVKVVTSAANSLEPDLLIELQKIWESRLEATKASNPVPDSVHAAKQSSGSGAKVFTSQSVGDALKLPSEVATEVVQQHIETALEVF